MNAAASDSPALLNVVGLATYPVEAPASRHRLIQFIAPLASVGVRMTFLPFLSSSAFKILYEKRVLRTASSVGAGILRRIAHLPAILGADALFVQREAMLVGPPVVEWLASAAGRPIVLDLDDATWLQQPGSVYGKVATLLKWPGKTDSLIKLASSVICGNAMIADHVTRAGRRAVIAPTIVDTTLFAPASRGADDDVPTIGWIGTHSTFAYFESILIPVLERLAETHRFRVRVVGSGRPVVSIRGVEVDARPWTLEREAEDFRTLDIGVYPLSSGEWEQGKSGFKAVQYLSVGVPFVASPVGVVASIGVPGETHLVAESAGEWYDALARLIENRDERRAMGEAGRKYALVHYSISRLAAVIAAELRLAVERNGRGAGAP